MSILIKGMEMPASCAKCNPEWRSSIVSKEGTRCYCRIAKQYGSLEIANQRRMDFCPLGDVPTPHGDLIDKGYAIATACSGLIRTLPTTEGGENWIRVTEVRESIKSAPTIIEAEDEHGSN